MNKERLIGLTTLQFITIYLLFHNLTLLLLQNIIMNLTTFNL